MLYETLENIHPESGDGRASGEVILVIHRATFFQCAYITSLGRSDSFRVGLVWSGFLGSKIDLKTVDLLLCQPKIYSLIVRDLSLVGGVS